MNKTIHAVDLGIHLKKGDESALFRWFVASFLMGKRIQAEIAAQAYRVIVEKHGRDTARKLGGCSHRELVLMLGEAHYVRYDETTATRLLSLAKNSLANTQARSAIFKHSARIARPSKNVSKHLTGLGRRLLRSSCAMLLRCSIEHLVTRLYRLCRLEPAA